MPQFERYFGIDYSGAKTPTSSLPRLRLYAATTTEPPSEVRPPASRLKHWTRRGLAEWLACELRDGPPTLVGIDHAFSFPLRYFEQHGLPHDWPRFLEDFHHHWPTDEDDTSVEFVRQGHRGSGAARDGNARWRRVTDVRARGKSVFHFDVQGSVAKSTHSGLPWLRYLRGALATQIHFWPFDGWTPPPGHSVIAEVYPALWSRTYRVDGRSPDQHDAYSAARWMQERDAAGELMAHFHPQLDTAELDLAQVEGWILGLS